MSLRRATWLVGRREFMERIRTRAFQISLAHDGPRGGGGRHRCRASSATTARSEYTVGAVGPEAQWRRPPLTWRAARSTCESRWRSSRAPPRRAPACATRASTPRSSATRSSASRSRPTSSSSSLQAGLAPSCATGAGASREGLSGGGGPARALHPPPLRTVALEGEDDGGEGVAFVASLVLYLQLIMYGIAVASGVVEEKASRVIEVLLATVQPRAILAGKILGIGALGLLQLALTAVVGLAAAARERCDRARLGRCRHARRRARVVPVRLPALVVAVRDRGRDGVAPGGPAVLHDRAHRAARDRLPARVPVDRRP